VLLVRYVYLRSVQETLYSAIILFGEARREDLGNVFEIHHVGFVEAVQIGAVDVDHAEALVVAQNRHDNLAVCIPVASDVVGECMHVPHDLDFLFAGGRATHATAKLDLLASDFALEGPENKLGLVLVHEVEAGPVDGALRPGLAVEVVPKKRRRVGEVRDPVIDQQPRKTVDELLVALILLESVKHGRVGVHPGLPASVGGLAGGKERSRVAMHVLAYVYIIHTHRIFN